jgi:hypothetical protein
MPCRHEVLIAEIVAEIVMFYECQNCFAKFDHHLTPYVEKPVTVTEGQ